MPPKRELNSSSERSTSGTKKPKKESNSSKETEVAKKISKDVKSSTKSKETVKANSNQLESISSVFSIDLLATSLFSLLTVSDLSICRQVSKRWRSIANDDSVWLKKYIKAAKIPEDKVEHNKPDGHFRRMYLDRFGRVDQLRILASNYKSTKDVKFLQAFAKVAATSSKTYERTYGDGEASAYLNGLQRVSEQYPAEYSRDSSFEDFPVFVINNFVTQSADYFEDTDGSCYMNAITATATLYSRTTSRRVRLGFEDARITDHSSGSEGTINMLALYDGTTTPEHLCQLATYDEDVVDEAEEDGNPYTEIGHRDAYVELKTPACEKLLQYLDFPSSTTPRHLVKAIGEVIQETYDCYGGDNIDDGIYEIPTPPVDIDKLVSYYGSLANRAKGELQRLRAIQVAKERGSNQHIISLLENTIYQNYSEGCGKPAPELYGGEFNGFFTLCYGNCATFKLPLGSSHATFTTAMENNEQPPNMSDERHLSVSVGDKSLIKIERGETVSTIIDNIDALDEIVKQLKIPALTHVDLFYYILIAGNLVDQLTSSNAKAAKWWTLKSLKGKEFNIEVSNNTRLPVLKAVQAKAVQIRNEIHWDGKQPAGFKLKRLHDDESSDEDEENEDSEDDEDEQAKEDVEVEGENDDDETLPFKRIDVEESVSVKDILAENDVDDAVWIFYELTKSESISKGKQIIIQNKSSQKYFYGAEARKMLKIGNENAKLKKPKSSDPYTVWIQSTSQSRGLQEGTTLLYTLSASLPSGKEESESENSEDEEEEVKPRKPAAPKKAAPKKAAARKKAAPKTKKQVSDEEDEEESEEETPKPKRTPVPKKAAPKEAAPKKAAPKKAAPKATKQVSDDENEGESEEETPKPKKAAPKKAAPKSKKRVSDDEDDEMEDENDETSTCPYKTVEVTTACTITEFQKSKKISASTVFYELTKAEKVSASKEIVVQEKSSKKFFTGAQARSKLGVGQADANITKAMCKPFHVWVQSTSSTRNLVVGTRFMYY